MIYSMFRTISYKLSACIKVEMLKEGIEDDEWIDVTNRCQFVDDSGGVALLFDVKDGKPFINDKHQIVKRWHVGRFRTSIPNEADGIVRDEFSGKFGDMGRMPHELEDSDLP